METTSRTIVVVDDEPDVLDLICSVLEDEGYSVVRLSHPVYTRDLKGYTPQPSLFVLDIMLPTMSGIQLARSLREDGYKNTPMIAMSASPSMLQVADESALFQHSIGKPFDLDALLQAVERHLRTDQD
jgi:two-component system OmpR family response regulator